MDRLLRAAPAGIAPKNYAPSAVDEQENRIIAIKRVEYLGDYSLQLEFNDGKKVTIDFGSYLRQSLNPLIRKYLDTEEFRKYSLDYGDLQWNNYDLCFPVADLYEGQV